MHPPAELGIDSFQADRSRTAATARRRCASGRFADLGYEIDVIVVYRYLNRVSAEVVLGRFDPGAAFDDRDSAYKAEAQLRVKF
jgi:hypothetical protein